MKMNGREVFKIAVRALEETCREVLAAEKLTPGDVKYVIAHQANKRILDATLNRLEIPASKCWMNLEKYGNTSAASVPMTLDEANRAGWFKPGDVDPHDGHRRRHGLGRRASCAGDGEATTMGKLAFIFPGQGSQAVGMGKDLHDAFPEARAVFDAGGRRARRDALARCASRGRRRRSSSPPTPSPRS